MIQPIPFDRDFAPERGRAVEIGSGVRRLTANNPGPFTFQGTNSYIVGKGRVAVLDPGPDDPAHVAALLAATEGETISHIIVTHTHRDHSEAAAALKAATGALTVGAGPHRPARPPQAGEEALLDASADTRFSPELVLGDGGVVEGEDWRLEAIATPGHAANHLAFALGGSDAIFTGDHVMGWATTVVAPPDGAMADYMASLGHLLDRPERTYVPGHGGPIHDGPAFVRALRGHRLMRESAILDRLAKGDRTITDIVRAIYRDTDPRLHQAAGLSVLAHLEDLTARGRVISDGPPSVSGAFRLA